MPPPRAASGDAIAVSPSSIELALSQRQQLGSAVGEPLLGSGGLALWTVPIATGVVRDAQVGAGYAALDCPPNAAVRQRSIANMTLSWPRLT